MAAPISPDERARILADLQAIADGSAPERSAGAIARAYGRARSTVTRIAEQHDLGHLWDRERTARASQARAVDNRERRTRLAEGFLDDVDLMRARLRKSYTFAAATKDGIDRIVLEEPPAGETAAFVRAAKTALDSHLAVEKHDSDGGADEGRGAMLAFLDAVRATPPGSEPVIERAEGTDDDDRAAAITDAS